MVKLSHTARSGALAALLTLGLAGSATVTLVPQTAQAQRYYDSDDRYRGDWDDRYRGDADDRYYHRDWDDHRYWNGRTWVGIGVPGFGIGFYDYPYYSGYYGPYCSSYDYYNGYCSY